MDYIFEDCVSGILETAIRVDIETDFLKRISAFVSKITEKKAGEQHHIVDNMRERKRFTTGFLGEAALEKVLGIPIIDWTIGDSRSYHVPDIPGYSVGIKTVEYGKFPIIFKRNYYPQIICIADTKKAGSVYVCGIASIDILNKYQDDSLILDNKLRIRGTKTGFYGFDYLQNISGLIDLEPYKKDNSQCIIKYAKKNAQHITKDQKICPQCNNKMVLKSGKYGQFWGCTAFPYCQYTENI